MYLFVVGVVGVVDIGIDIDIDIDVDTVAVSVVLLHDYLRL